MGIGYVYMIEAMKMKRFKIGKAKVLPRRFNQLDTASPCELRIYGVIKSENYESIERELHNKLDSRRTKRANRRPKEWFKLTKREVEKIVFKYGGFCAADGDYANDLSLFDKVVRWIDNYPRVVEKFCCSVVGAMMLSYLAASMEPAVMPEASTWIPEYRSYEPKIELVQDCRLWIFKNFLKERGADDLGIKLETFMNNWNITWMKGIYDSLNSNKQFYQERKQLESGWSILDSAEFVLNQYIRDELFSAAYEDSTIYSYEQIKDFLHKPNDCPFKNQKLVEIDGELIGGHKECLGELELRKIDAEKAYVVLRKIRNIYPSMTQ